MSSRGTRLYLKQVINVYRLSDKVQAEQDKCHAFSVCSLSAVFFCFPTFNLTITSSDSLLVISSMSASGTSLATLFRLASGVSKGGSSSSMPAASESVLSCLLVTG